jgi:hypothetical protein
MNNQYDFKTAGHALSVQKYRSEFHYSVFIMKRKAGEREYAIVDKYFRYRAIAVGDVDPRPCQPGFNMFSGTCEIRPCRPAPSYSCLPVIGHP